MSRQWTARAKAALDNCDLKLALKYLQTAQQIEDTPKNRRRINRITIAIRETEGQSGEKSGTETSGTQVLGTEYFPGQSPGPMPTSVIRELLGFPLFGSF